MSIDGRRFRLAANVLILGASLVAPIVVHAQEPDKKMTESVERLVKPLFDSESVNALSLGFVDGDKTYVLNFGKLSVDRPVLPDANTVYEIGSITKVFTATVLADMVVHKEVALSDPVQRYLPAGFKMPQYEGTPITLLDLATQSSGLPSLPTNFAPTDMTNPYKGYSVDMLYKFLASYKLTRKPGEKYEYSNMGVGLLGIALAHRADTGYEALVKQHILDPLHMNETCITLTPFMQSHLAPGHDADGEPAASWDLDTFAGAGALRSNTNDMLRFLKANLGLAPAALEAAMTLAQKPERLIAGPGHIGLNWHILADGKVTWHNGGTDGYRTMLAMNREKRQGVVVLCNTACESITPLGFDLLSLLAGESPEPLKLPAEVKLDPTQYERYVGVYEFQPGAVLTVMRYGDHLTAQLTGQPAYRIYASAETEFYYRVAPAKLTFEVNGKGIVTGLVLHQNGMNTSAKKIK